MMKLAYIILAHKNADQVYRLYNKLNYPDASFVIHVSTCCEEGFFNDITSIFRNTKNVFFCKREDGTHNAFGIVKGAINALKLLIEKNINFDYVNLISGQDYPIKSNKFIQDFFSENQGKQFILNFQMLPHPDSEEYKNKVWFPSWSHQQEYRVDKFWIHYKKNTPRRGLPYSRIKDKSLWANLKIFLYEMPQYIRENRLKEEVFDLFLSLCLPINRKYPSNIDLYGGFTWWSITKDCAEYIITFYKKNKNFNRFYKYSLIPDEMYFQTLLMNSGYKKNVVNNCLREIEWKGGDGTHPILFESSHFERLKNSENLFARKFDVNFENNILDLIDQHLLYDKQ